MNVEQIRRAHASARPVQANPAWMNCHHDCGFLLARIEHLEKALRAIEANATKSPQCDADRLARVVELVRIGLAE
jgi:hypothetical protein